MLPILNKLCAAAAVVLALALARRVWVSRSRARKGLRDPPGPPRLFLLDNLLDIPAKDAHVAYARMAEQYGPIMQLTLPTQNIVVLGSAKVAVDLLEKRGSIYSDRPRFAMAELMGWGFNLTFQQHGDPWRARRRLLHQHMHAGANAKHAGLQTHTAVVFAKRLLDAPTKFLAHIKRCAAANIAQTTYGIEVALDDDPFVKLANDALESVTPVLIPGAYAVDFLPALKHIPTWFPGAKFKRDAAEWRKYPEELLSVPFARVQADMERGTAQPSMVAEALALDAGEDYNTVVKEAAAVMYLGGSDTTISSITSFFLQMVLCPDVQRKAHDELDRVVGRDRLPTFADRDSLPYIEAIIREVYRVIPVGPLGLPHAVEEDDIYEGMFIAKGSIVIPNIWRILRDPTTYPNPDAFTPERFLRDGKIDDTVSDPRENMFGYGRRICPGKHFADTTVYIAVVTTLACFDIGNEVENGVEIPPSGEIQHGIISTPAPFKCSIKPRSEKVATLIENALAAHC